MSSSDSSSSESPSDDDRQASQLLDKTKSASGGKHQKQPSKAWGKDSSSSNEDKSDSDNDSSSDSSSNSDSSSSSSNDGSSSSSNGSKSGSGGGGSSDSDSSKGGSSSTEATESDEEQPPAKVPFGKPQYYPPPKIKTKTNAEKPKTKNNNKKAAATSKANDKKSKSSKKIDGNNSRTSSPPKTPSHGSFAEVSKSEERIRGIPAAPVVQRPKDYVEMRGTKELGLIGSSSASSAKEEVTEANIPEMYNDTYLGEAGGDQLRLLDDFYFCLGDGSPVGLDVLDSPPEKRPVVMAFGTLLQPLPLEQRPTIPPFAAVPLWPESQGADGSPSKTRQSPEKKLSGHKRKRTESGSAKSRNGSSSSGSGTDSDNDADKSKATGKPSAESASTPASASPVLGSIPEKSKVENMAVNGDDRTATSGLQSSSEPLRDRIRVCIPKVDEWCIDYTYGDPTLWIITERAWYKIGGPLSGVRPHWSYVKAFHETRMKFEACIAVAGVLQDLLPIQRKLSFRTAMLEITGRTRIQGYFVVTQEYVVQNYKFIIDQMSSLDGDDEKKRYQNSRFVSNLRRLGEASDQREEKHKKIKQERDAKEMERQKDKERRDKEKEQSRKQKEAEKEASRLAREAARQAEENAKRYPIDDKALILENEANGIASKPPPSFIHPCLLLPHLMGDVIMCWNTIRTFQEHLQVHKFSLTDLCGALVNEKQQPWLLSDIFQAILLQLLTERDRNEESHTEDLDDEPLEPAEKRAVSMHRAPLLNALSWQELLREVIGETYNIDTSISGIDPLINCKDVLERIKNHQLVEMFMEPVDPEALGIPTYFDIIKSPMDLSTVTSRLESGWYQPEDISVEEKKSSPLEANVTPKSASGNSSEDVTGAPESRESAAKAGPKVDVKYLSSPGEPGKERGGYEAFAADMRLIWSNAVLFNGRQSPVGKMAFQLATAFEKEFTLRVISKIQGDVSTESQLVSISADAVKQDVSKGKALTPKELVRQLGAMDFANLPLETKVAALAWACGEVMSLSFIRDMLSNHMQDAVDLVASLRAEERDDIQARRGREKERREAAETAEDPQQALALIEAEEEEEQQAFHERQKERQKRMDAYFTEHVIRLEPLGRDRFGNRYWHFPDCEIPALWVEDGLTGHMCAYQNTAGVSLLLKWLDERGRRELHLKQTLTKDLERITHGMADGDEAAYGVEEETELRSEVTFGKKKYSIEEEQKVSQSMTDAKQESWRHYINHIDGNKGYSEMCPSLGEHFPSIVVKVMKNGVIDPVFVAQSLLSDYETRLNEKSVLGHTWAEGKGSGDCRRKRWNDRLSRLKLEDNRSGSELRSLLLELESQLHEANLIVVQAWRSSRVNWRRDVSASRNYSQLSLLLSRFHVTALDRDAIGEHSVVLDRKQFMRLVKSRNKTYIPEEGADEEKFIYFGEGHQEAISEDAAYSSSWSSTGPIPGTYICKVKAISYHTGKNNPYARVLATVESLAEAREDLTAQRLFPEESRKALCTVPSPTAKLHRLLGQILSSLKVLPAASAFLEPVNFAFYPDYKEVVSVPMDLSTIGNKVAAEGYTRSEQFLSDVRLIASNCHAYCDSRFPKLPPVADSLVQACEEQWSAVGEEIARIEALIAANGADTVDASVDEGSSNNNLANGSSSSAADAISEASPDKIEFVLRLESGLPEFVVPCSKYASLVRSSWSIGDRVVKSVVKPNGIRGSASGTITDSKIFLPSRLLPWKSLTVQWDSQHKDWGLPELVNPWDIELEPLQIKDNSKKKGKGRR